MNKPGPDRPEGSRLDKGLVRAAFNRAAHHYDAAAVLQHEVGNRLLERLELIRLIPRCIFDIGCGTGRLTTGLARRYPRSRVIAVDLAPEMLRLAQCRSPILNKWLGRQVFVCGDAEQLPFADHSAEMIFSNLVLQWCNDLEQTFTEFHRVLKPGGLLMFTSFGPDTLKELRASWKGVDDRVHVHTFIDMHEIGDILLHTRFADPVMDVERFTLTYGDVRTLMRDLKTIGAHNAATDRPHRLMGKGRLKRLSEAYEDYRRDGQLPASYEVVYGHAWTPVDKPDRPRHSRNGAITIPVSQLQRPTHP